MSEEIGIATGLRPQPRSFPWVTGEGIGGEAVGAKLKGRVGEGEEAEKLGMTARPVSRSAIVQRRSFSLASSPNSVAAPAKSQATSWQPTRSWAA